jgi:hypothetical protein
VNGEPVRLWAIDGNEINIRFHQTGNKVNASFAGPSECIGIRTRRRQDDPGMLSLPEVTAAWMLRCSRVVRPAKPYQSSESENSILTA